MKEFLILRLDAPLMSFGGTRVDQIGPTQDHPSLSLLTGLLGSALGFRHRDPAKLQSLQERIRYGVRRERAGVLITDYQTVDLGQDFLVETGWTTWGHVQSRAGAFSEGTHIRYRDYWADAEFTVVLTLEPAETQPTVDALANALTEPARPLFIGRKPCLPAAPIFRGRVEAASIVDALRKAPSATGVHDGHVWAWWPEDEGGPAGEVRVVTDERDWANQIHGGERLIREGWLPLEGGRG
ncbi:MAG: type I-E CRISPR-associated protein Cas5/CasD [bacterium]